MNRKISLPQCIYTSHQVKNLAKREAGQSLFPVNPSVSSHGLESHPNRRAKQNEKLQRKLRRLRFEIKTTKTQKTIFIVHLFIGLLSLIYTVVFRVHLTLVVSNNVYAQVLTTLSRYFTTSLTKRAELLDSDSSSIQGSAPEVDPGTCGVEGTLPADELFTMVM